MRTREKERRERAWRAKEDESGVRGIREESTVKLVLMLPRYRSWRPFANAFVSDRHVFEPQNLNDSGPAFISPSSAELDSHTGCCRGDQVTLSREAKERVMRTPFSYFECV